MIRPCLALMIVVLCGSPARAQDTTIYRCTDAQGAVTLQNGVPCGPGLRQDIRKVGALPTGLPPRRPAPVPAADAPPPGANFELVVGPQRAPLPEPDTPLAERAPPPALFECTTWDDDVYLSEYGEPAPQCAPLATVGIGGNAGIGAGAACEMRADQCVAIAAGQLCPAWHRHVSEAEFRWKFARAEAGERKLEYERLAKLLADSNCPR